MCADYTRKPRPKYCGFCRERVEQIDFKDTSMLKRYITDRGKIKPRRVTGNCTQHQRQLSIAIKRAREMALLAYSSKQ